MANEPSPWQVKFWRVAYLNDLELMHGSNITHDYPQHIHETYCIVIVLRGEETHICRNMRHKALPGSILLINAEEPHSSKSVGTEYRIIYASAKILGRIGLDVLGRNFETVHFRNPIFHDRSVFHSLLKLHLKLEQNISSPLEQESEIISTIGSLLARHAEYNSVLQPVGKELRYTEVVRNYLRAHYSENITLSELASLTNLSPFHLLRSFREHVGVPPHEYQTQVRITHAGRLIRLGRPISEAALETGFFDQSHLSRHFKRITGMTPGYYSLHSNFIQDATK
jgi:AraC-like DNA-binding protein